MQSNESIELSPEELQAADGTQERLRQPDAHLVESAVETDYITKTSKPTVRSKEELQADQDTQERLATPSPWLDGE